jgi:hypothetical protein
MKQQITVLSTVAGAEMLTDDVYLLTWIKDLGIWNKTSNKITKHGLWGTTQRKHPLTINRQTVLPFNCITRDILKCITHQDAWFRVYITMLIAMISSWSHCGTAYWSHFQWSSSSLKMGIDCPKMVHSYLPTPCNPRGAMTSNASQWKCELSHKMEQNPLSTKMLLAISTHWHIYHCAV